MKITYSLELPAEAETVPVVRGLVRTSMLEMGIDADRVADIALALTEACSNVVAHADVDEPEERGGGYNVEICFDRERCEIEVVDHGEGFDAEHMVPAMPAWESEHGRGIALITTLMDHVTLRSAPGAGTVVAFQKGLVLAPDAKLRRVAT